MKNLPLKIAAVLCAISLWFFVVTGRTHRIERAVPLRIIHLASEIAVVTALPENITLLLEGTGRDLLRLGDSTLIYDLDLSGSPLGTQHLQLSTDRVHIPRGMAIKALAVQGPQTLEVELDTRIRRRVPVRNMAQLSAAEGFVVVQTPVPQPSEIEISGARRNITRVFETRTAAVQISGLTRDTLLTLALDPNGMPPQIRLETPAVLVSVSVQPLKRRTFAEIPVQLVGGPNRRQWSLSPALAAVEVTGGKEIVESLQTSEIKLFIEFTRFAIEGTEALAPSVAIQRPLQSWQVKPETFRLQALSPISGQEDTSAVPGIF